MAPINVRVPYDMLRTQVLQSMSVGGWKVLGVTSPTPGCGKTVTATNLALSIARLPDHLVVLVDLDLQKPQIANSLGIVSTGGGVLDLLEGDPPWHGLPRRFVREGSNLWCCRRLPRESPRN